MGVCFWILLPTNKCVPKGRHICPPHCKPRTPSSWPTWKEPLQTKLYRQHQSYGWKSRHSKWIRPPVFLMSGGSRIVLQWVFFSECFFSLTEFLESGKDISWWREASACSRACKEPPEAPCASCRVGRKLLNLLMAKAASSFTHSLGSIYWGRPHSFLRDVKVMNDTIPVPALEQFVLSKQQSGTARNRRCQKICSETCASGLQSHILAHCVFSQGTRPSPESMGTWLPVYHILGGM